MESSTELSVGQKEKQTREEDEAEFLAHTLPLFPILGSLGVLWPSLVSTTAILITCIQPLSYILNAHWSWGTSVGRLSEVSYFFLLPFWDTKYPYHWGGLASLVAFWVLIFFTTTLTVVIVFCLKVDLLKGKPLVTFRVAVHLVTSTALMPSLLIIMSAMVCDSDKVNVYLTPDVSCASPTHYLAIFAGSISYCLIALYACTVRTLLYVDTPFSQVRTARCHHYNEVISLCYEIITPILYVNLIASNKHQLFASLHSIATFLLAVSYAFILPYYNDTSNVVKVSSYFTASVTSAIASGLEWEVTQRNADISLLIITFILCWSIGISVVRFGRMNGQAQAACRSIRLNPRDYVEEVLESNLKYPTRLPWHDLSFGNFSKYEEALTPSKDTDSVTEVDAVLISKVKPVPTMRVPGLTCIYLPTDIELCCRLLREYCQSVEEMPTPKMLLYYGRIYNKGICKYPDCLMLRYHFALFLANYCEQYPMALSEVRKLQKEDLSIPLIYRLYKFSTLLKSVLNIRDCTHQKVLQRARSLHKQTLGYMVSFWVKLLSDKFDTLDIAQLANTITEKRDEGMQVFEEAVATKCDIATALGYAKFLEQVMLDVTGAQLVREKILEPNDDKSVKSGSLHCQSQTEELRNHIIKSFGNKRLRKTKSKTINRLSAEMHILFVVFAIIIAGVGVLNTILGTRRNELVSTAHEAGDLRALVVHGAYISRRIRHAAEIEKMGDSACRKAVCNPLGKVQGTNDCSKQSFLKTTELKAELLKMTNEIRDITGKLTYGGHRTSYGPLIAHYGTQSTEIITVAGNDTGSARLAGLWEVILLAIASFESILDSDMPCLTEGAPQAFLDENSLFALSHSMNVSLNLYEEQFELAMTEGLVINIFLFFGGLFVVICVYFVLEINFLKIGMAKMETLNLFALIPKNTVTDIHADSSDHLLNFEIADTQPSGDSSASVVNDEDNEQIADEDGETAFAKIFSKNTAKADGAYIKHKSDTEKSVLGKERQVVRQRFDDDEMTQLDDDATNIESKRSYWSRYGHILLWGGRGLSVAVWLVTFILFFIARGLMQDDINGSLVELDYENIRSQLLRDIRTWEKNAQFYSLTCDLDAYVSYNDISDKRVLEKTLSALQLLVSTPHYHLEITEGMKKLRETHDYVMRTNRCDNPLKEYFVDDYYDGSLVGLFEKEEHVVAKKKLFDAVSAMNHIIPRPAASHDVLLLVAVLEIVLAAMFLLLPSHSSHSTVSNILFKLCSVVTVVNMLFTFACLRNVDIVNSLRVNMLDIQTATDKMETVLFSSESSLYAYISYRDLEHYEGVENHHVGDAVAEVVQLLIKEGYSYDSLSQLQDKIAEYSMQHGHAVVAAALSNNHELAEIMTVHLLTMDIRGLNNSELYAKAQYTIRSKEYVNSFKEFHTVLEELNLYSYDVFKGKEALANRDTKTIMVIVLAALILGHGILSGVSVSKSSQVTNTKESAASPAALFVDLTSKIRMSLVIVALILIAISIFEIKAVLVSRDLAPRINQASSREWLVCRGILSSQQYLERSVGSTLPGHLRWSKEIVHEVIGELRESSDRLYFGPGSKKDFTALEVFGPTKSKNSRTQCANVDYIPFIDVDSECRRFSSRILELRYEDSHEQLSNDDMLTYVEHVLTALRDNTRKFEQRAKKEISKQQLSLTILLSIMVAVLVLEYVIVFEPVTARLQREEEATKLMLRMIPEKERRTVGAIVEYLETGKITTNTKLQEVSEAVSEMNTIPTIAIDGYGTVLKFSKLAEELFGFTDREVIGCNVKKIIPEDIAKNHDFYLARYRKTGVRHIVGSDRNVKGQKKDGTLFPANICVRESRRGRKSIFIGFVTDITLDLENARATQLNATISKTSSTPFVCANQKGGIIRWNKAAVDVFGFTEKEALQCNLKVLMTPEVAEKHDSYIETYLRTKKKTVIGNTVRQVAVRKGGETFPIELRVEELMWTGSERIFNACVKDITSVVRATRLVAIHEIMMRMSPTPMVMAGQTGIITQVNPQAELELGWTSRDAVGKNVKILQPDNVKAKHDGYLSAYVKTGKKKMIGKTADVKLIRKDGTSYDVALSVRSVSPPPDSSFQHVFLAFFRDLTTDKRNEAVALTTAKSAALSPTPYICIDEIGTMMVFNKAATQLIGYTEQEAVGQNVKMIQPPDVAAKHDGYLATYKLTGEKRALASVRIMKCRKKTGDVFSCELKIAETILPTGEKRFSGYIMDVTVRETTIINNEMCDAVVSICPYPLIAINPQGRIQVFSKAAAQQFGHTTESVMNRNVKIIMPEEYAAEHDRYLQNYLDTGKPNIIGKIGVPVTAMRANGGVFQAEISIQEVKKQQVRVFAAVIIDVEALRGKDDKLRVANVIMMKSPSATIVIGATGLIDVFSYEALKLFGYSDFEEVRGKNIKMMMPEKRAEMHDHYLSMYAKKGIKNVIGRDFRELGKRLDGTEVELAFAIREHAITDMFGVRWTKFIAYATDTREAYLAEQANVLNEVAVDMADLPFVRLSLTGKIVRINREAEECFQYTSREAIGMNIRMFMPEEIASKHDGYLAKYRKTGTKTVINQTTRQTGIRKNGKTFPVEICVRELEEVDGQMWYCGSIRDITARTIEEQELDRAKKIVSLTSEPMVCIDAKGIMLEANVALSNLTGFDVGTLKGSNIKILMPEEISVKHDQYLKSYLKTRERTIIGGEPRNIVFKTRRGELNETSIRVQELEGEGIYVGFFSVDFQENLLSETNQKTHEALFKLLINPTLMMTHLGIIKEASVSCESFGFARSDLVGSNITMIQPPEVASVHDDILATYTKTRIPHVIGSERRIKVQKKDGVLVEHRIIVKEVTPPDHPEPLFLGELTDTSGEDLATKTFSKMNSLLQQAPFGIFKVSEIGTVELVNKYTEIFGYEEKEYLGQNIKMITGVHKERHDMYLQKYKETRVKHIIDTSQRLKAETKDGTQLDVNVTVREIEGKNGMFPPVFVACVSDASQEIKMEAAHCQSKFMLDNIPLPLVVTDTEGVISKFSLSFERTFGWKSSPVGSNITSIQPRKVAEKHGGYLKAYLQSGVKTVMDTKTVVTASSIQGERIKVELWIKEFAIRNQKHYVGFIRDLRYTTAAEDSKRTGEIIATNCSASIVCITEKGIIKQVNPAFLSLTKYAEEDLIDNNIRHIMPEPHRTNHDSYLANYMETKITKVINATTAVSIISRSNTEIAVQLTVKQLDRIGEPPMFLGSIKDAREELILERVSKQSQILQELCPETVITLTNKGIIHNVNLACSVIGYTPEELINNNITMIMDPAIAPEHPGYLKRYEDTGEKRAIGKQTAVKVLNKDGILRAGILLLRECGTQSSKGENKQTFFVGFITF